MFNVSLPKVFKSASQLNGVPKLTIYLKSSLITAEFYNFTTVFLYMELYVVYELGSYLSGAFRGVRKRGLFLVFVLIFTKDYCINLYQYLMRN